MISLERIFINVMIVGLLSMMAILTRSMMVIGLSVSVAKRITIAGLIITIVMLMMIMLMSMMSQNISTLASITPALAI